MVVAVTTYNEVDGHPPFLAHLVSFHHSPVAACSGDGQVGPQRGGA